MLIQTAFVVALAGGTVGLALADSPAEPQTTQVAAAAPAPQQPVVSTTSTPAKEPTLKPGNSIVVHRDTRANDAHDCRVDVGGFRVSTASPVIIEDKDGNKHTLILSVSPNCTDGAIAIPDNTFGPGEPMWAISDRISANARIAQADADTAASAAARPYDFYDNNYIGGIYHGISNIGGWGSLGGYGNRWFGGPRGPVTSTTTRFDDLGSTAQRAYSDAAYPRNRANIEAQDRAQREFNRAATPPIAPTQDAVDRAHNEANHEHPRPAEPTQNPPRR